MNIVRKLVLEDYARMKAEGRVVKCNGVEEDVREILR